MQEEVENRAVTLVISATKLTGRLLKAAILEISGKPQGEAAAKSPAPRRKSPPASRR